MRRWIFSRKHLGTSLLLLVFLPFMLGPRSRSVSPSQIPVFTDVAAQAGLVLAHDPNPFICMSMIGTGATWGDYDGDGHLDLFVTNFFGPQHLYRNNGDGTFTDVAAAAGVRNAPSQATGATFVDYDNDGHKDLLVLARGGLALYHNNGNGTFTDVTAKSGLSNPMERGTTAAWGDYDNDGFVDLYITNHAWCREKDTPTQDWLYHNNGDGTFTDVTYLLGPMTGRGYGFSAGWLDYNGDGKLDLYVVNDYLGFLGRAAPNMLWRNDGPDGHGGWVFTNVSRESRADKRMEGMGLAVGDFNNDGHLDMAVTNVGPIALLRNNGDGTFTDVAFRAGVGRMFARTGQPFRTQGSPLIDDFINRLWVTWGIGFFDFNNDGWQDLHLVGGYLQVPAVAPDALFLNNRDETFTDVSLASGIIGPLDQVDQGRTSAYADYDKDGFMDIFVAQYGEPPLLYHNDSRAKGNPNHWLVVELQGTVSNRDGIGAKVRVTAGGLTQLRQVRCGTSHGSGDMLAAHFGLEGAAQVDRVEITWPSGRVQTLTAVAADQWLVVIEK